MMLSNYQRRGLAFLLAFAMTFSLVPVTGFATEEETEPATVETTVTETEPAIIETTVPETEPEVETTATTEVVTEPTEETEAATETQTVSEIESVVETVPVVYSVAETEASKLLAQYQEQIDDILTRYLGTTEISAEDIEAAVAEMDWETYQTARSEIYDLETELTASQESEMLTEADIQMLVEDNAIFCDFSSSLEARAANDNSATVYAEKETLLFNDTLSIKDSLGTGSGTATKYTITAKGTTTSRKTNNIVITNNASKKMILKCDYSVDNAYSHTFPADSGIIDTTLDSGATLSYSITSKTLGRTVTLKLENITFTEAPTTIKVTTDYDSTLGSVKVNGAELSTSGTDVEPGNFTLVAAPKAGSEFVGWFDSQNTLLETNTSYPTANVTSNFNVKAVFTTAASDALFLVNNVLYSDWDKAFAAGTTVVLAANGTLPTGDYTVPSSKQFLIPYNTDDDGTFGKLPDTYPNSGDNATSAYKKLTLEEGAHLTVDGALNVNAKVRAYTNRDTGCVSGTYGQIDLKDNSTITVNGSLYCFGYITGTGTVTAKNGATVAELLQLRDWTGSSTATSWKANSFMVSQYYVQNIEAPYVLEGGAESYVALSIYVASLYNKVKQETAAFIGKYVEEDSSSNSGLIQIPAGSSLHRVYDSANDRIIYTVNGIAHTADLNLTIKENGILGIGSFEYPLNTANYVMGLNNRMTFYIPSGSYLSVESKFKLLPGTELNVDAGGTVEVQSGAELYLYDEADWYIRYTLWANNSSKGPEGYDVQNQTVKFSPTRETATKTNSGSAKLNVDGTLKLHGNVFTTAGSVNKLGDGATISDPKSTDKIVTGTGKIENYAAWGTGNLTETNAWFADASDNYEATIKTVPLVAQLAGISGNIPDYYSIAAGTADSPTIYYGLGEEYGNLWYRNKTVVAPTCTEDGYTNYYCEDETKVYTVTGDTATGHNYKSTVTAPTCDKGGYTTHTCTACGNSYTDSETPATGKHNWVGGICSVCGEKFSFYKANVIMENSLNMMFAFPADVCEDWTGYYVVVDRVSANDKTNTQETIPYSEWTTGRIGNASYKIVTYTGLAAKEMCDTLTLTVHNAAGEAVSLPWVDSMRTYAMRILGNATKDTQKTLVVDFLNYGAAAQTHFEYAADDLANNKLTSEQQGWATKTVKEFTNESDLGEKWKGSNLILENNISFQVAFHDLNTTMRAVIEFTHHNKSNKTSVEIPGTAFGNNSGYYFLTIDELVVADARQEITITIYDANNEVFTTCKDSIEYYLARYSDDPKAINTAVMKFADAAYAYLHG